MTFSDSQVNNLLAKYLELKDGNMDANSTDILVDDDVVINDLVINIDKMK